MTGNLTRTKIVVLVAIVLCSLAFFVLWTSYQRMLRNEVPHGPTLSSLEFPKGYKVVARTSWPSESGGPPREMGLLRVPVNANEGVVELVRSFERRGWKVNQTLVMGDDGCVSFDEPQVYYERANRPDYESLRAVAARRAEWVRRVSTGDGHEVVVRPSPC